MKILIILLLLPIIILVPNAFAHGSDIDNRNNDDHHVIPAGGGQTAEYWQNYINNEIIVDEIEKTISSVDITNNHTNILYEDSTGKLISHPYEYLLDYDGSFVPYRVTENDDMVQVESKGGKYVFDKINGAVTIYKDNEIQIDSDSYIVKVAEPFTDNWTELDFSNVEIETVVVEKLDVENLLNNYVIVQFIRENNEGIFKTEYIVDSGEMKTTVFFTNLGQDRKVSFTETLNLNSNIINFNNEEIDLNDYIGESFSREILEQNMDLIIEIKDVNYNAGLGFENLWSATIFENNKIALDYANIGDLVTATNETVELDPTVSTGQTTCSTGTVTSWSCTMTAYSAISGAVVSHIEVNWGNQSGASYSTTKVNNLGNTRMTMGVLGAGSGDDLYCELNAWNSNGWLNGQSGSGSQVAGHSSGGTGNGGTYGCHLPTGSQYYDSTINGKIQNGQTYTIDYVTFDFALSQPQTVIMNVGIWSEITYSVPTVAGAPTSVAVDTQDVANEITLNWVTPSSDGNSAISNYKIFLGGSLIATVGTVNTYDDTISGGEIGASLEYTVKTVNGIGDSVASNTATVTSWDVPAQVGTVTGTNGANPALSWSAPSSDGALTNYKIYRQGSLHDTISSSSTTYSDSTNLSSGSTYAYTVSGVSAVGEGAQSASVNVVAGVAPNPATGISASITNTATAPLEVTVSFSPSGTTGTGTVTGFQLLRDGVAVSTAGLVTSMANTVPAGGTTYAYTVITLGTHGNSVASSSSSVTTPNTPAQVTGLTVTPVSTSRIDLSWNTPNANNSLISGYKVQISSNGGSSYTDVLTGNVNTTYQSLSLATNSQYHYKVSAINGVGTGTASAVSNTYTMTPTPATLTATAVSEVQINLAWGVSTGATGYKIESESPSGNGFTTHTANTGNTDLTKSITGLTTATQYNFRVSGINAGGASVASPEASTFTFGILTAPTLDTITRLSPTSLKLDFTAGTGLPVATGYKIERQTGSGWIELIADTGNTDVTYTDSVLSSDQSATYRLYAINSIGTSPVSNERTSDVVASSGGGGGSSSRAVSSQTGSTGLIDLTFIDQIHRVVLGQFLSKSINVAWDSSDNLEVKSIIVGDSPFRIVFQDVPFVLIGDPSGISNGKINYSVQIPSELCTAQGQLNCVEQKQYEVPVEIQSVHKGSTLTKSSVIKIDLAGGSDIPLVFVLLAIGAVPLAFIIRKVGSGKSRRKASGSSHKSSKNGSNSKKVSL
jgi:hypothetical protein